METLTIYAEDGACADITGYGFERFYTKLAPVLEIFLSKERMSLSESVIYDDDLHAYLTKYNLIKLEPAVNNEALKLFVSSKNLKHVEFVLNNSPISNSLHPLIHENTIVGYAVDQNNADDINQILIASA